MFQVSQGAFRVSVPVPRQAGAGRAVSAVPTRAPLSRCVCPWCPWRTRTFSCSSASALACCVTHATVAAGLRCDLRLSARRGRSRPGKCLACVLPLRPCAPRLAARRPRLSRSRSLRWRCVCTMFHILRRSVEACGGRGCKLPFQSCMSAQRHACYVLTITCSRVSPVHLCRTRWSCGQWRWASPRPTSRRERWLPTSARK